VIAAGGTLAIAMPRTLRCNDVPSTSMRAVRAT
jgi:hypothetical protein